MADRRCARTWPCAERPDLKGKWDKMLSAILTTQLSAGHCSNREKHRHLPRGSCRILRETPQIDNSNEHISLCLQRGGRTRVPKWDCGDVILDGSCGLEMAQMS